MNYDTLNEKDLQGWDAVIRRYRTRILIISNPKNPNPPNKTQADPEILARKPVIPPVPEPTGGIDRYLIKRSEFEPYLEMMENEEFKVAIFDSKNEFVQTHTITTDDTNRPTTMFKKIPIIIENLRNNENYKILVDDGKGNSIQVTFTLIS